MDKRFSNYYYTNKLNCSSKTVWVNFTGSLIRNKKPLQAFKVSKQNIL